MFFDIPILSFLLKIWGICLHFYCLFSLITKMSTCFQFVSYSHRFVQEMEKKKLLAFPVQIHENREQIENKVVFL